MEILNCLLISPPIFYKGDESIWKNVNSNFPPLGLASIAAYVRAKNKSIKIIDCNVESPSIDHFENYFKENYVKHYSTIKYIGLTAMTPTIKKAYKIAEICKKFYPNVKIVFGGVHATFLPEEVLQNDLVDFVVIGEGELTFEELLSGKDKATINGLAYKVDDKIRINSSRERILDLDDFPMPAYDLLPIKKYRPAKGTYKKLPAMSMITSRGCPGRCTFCSKTLGNRIVFKKAETIFNEIKFLKRNFGIKQILFYDDTFTVFKKNVAELCYLLIKNKMNISWTCFARVDFIDKEQLRLMKRAGCHQILYGVENINTEVLKNIKKKINLQQVVKAVKWTKQIGIDCRVAFMIGNPGDNRKIIEENIAFVNKLNPDLLVVNITTPFPGTEMFKWAEERNLLLTYDWDDYNLSKPVMRLEDLDENQIKELYHLMYKKFYLRLNYILKKLFKMRSVDDFKILFDGFKALINFLEKSKRKKHLN